MLTQLNIIQDQRGTLSASAPRTRPTPAPWPTSPSCWPNSPATTSKPPPAAPRRPPQLLAIPYRPTTLTYRTAGKAPATTASRLNPPRPPPASWPPLPKPTSVQHLRPHRYSDSRHPAAATQAARNRLSDSRTAASNLPRAPPAPTSTSQAGAFCWWYC